MKIVYTTVDKKEKAEEIATKLVQEKLAACVNVVAAESIFSWKGAIEKEDEFFMVIKTKEDLADNLVDKVKELHPYELPVIEIIDTKINKEAEKWLNEVTK